MGTRRRSWVVGCLAACAGVLLAVIIGPSAPAQASDALAISVVGNQLESNGASVQLRGVNSNAYESCASNADYDATFAAAPADDPDDDFANGPVNQWSVAVMKSWGINTVRLALNESCWLGLPTAVGGASTSQTLPSRCESYAPEQCETAAGYRGAVENYVRLLGQNGLFVVLDLQNTAPPGYAATAGIDYYPDAADAPTFWQQLAGAFGAESNVLFDLTGEWAASSFDGPYYQPGNDGYTSADAGQNWSDNTIWHCWLDGCDDVQSLYGASYDTAGVQGLITAIRNAGASNPIVLGSPDYTLGYDDADCGPNDNQSCWATYAPTDPDGQLVYDAHMYDFSFENLPADGNGNADPTTAEEQTAADAAQRYITEDLAPVAQTSPVMLGELGEATCQESASAAPFVPAVLAAVDRATAQGLSISVLGWTWDADGDNGNEISSGWQCPTGVDGQGGPLLITDYDGTPTAMGQVFEQWFQARDPEHPPAPAAPNGAASGTTTAATTSTGAGSTGGTSTSTRGGSTSSTSTTSTTSMISTLATPTGTGTEAAPLTLPAGPGTAGSPTAVSAPHITVGGATLSCLGARFAGAGTAAVTYRWYDAVSGQPVSGPLPSDTIGATRVAGRAVFCQASAGAASARSAMLPVPGAISAAAAGPVRLGVMCPNLGQSCEVTLKLTRATSTLGRTALSLKPGRRTTARVGLTVAARRMLTRERRLRATLTVTETVLGARQTVAVAQLNFHR